MTRRVSVAFAEAHPALGEVATVLGSDIDGGRSTDRWTAARFTGDFTDPAVAAARGLVTDNGGAFLELPESLAGPGPGLLVSDVDSTLITSEVIELIADYAGTRDEVAEVTERAMRGELDFAASLTARVATLAGVPETVFAEVLEQVEFSPGARELAAALHLAGWTFGLVSGGFTEVVAGLACQLDITHYVANRLEVADGVLTGRVSGDIVTGSTKAAMLRQWAEELGIDPARTVAVGDGANDLEMMSKAAIGFAYRAKPIVAEQATARIDFPALDVIAELLGLEPERRL
ncbi:phosphoserine phosphatase SerB [Enemella sp. A6]|uniref:phosphoserine phosphatase SerB n=1 Tax=Enemella sp. A6 TaxID=3440152 RepID=UPI003EB79B43